MIAVFEGHSTPVSNPNPVEVMLENGTRAVLLAFDTMHNPTDMTTWSADDGMAWSNAKSFAYPPEKNVGALIGPAVGLQVDDGALFFWITSGFLAISRDNGST
jgi:hypothetical protein